MGSQVDWTQVLVALVAGLPATIAAVGTIWLSRQMRTPSGDAPGKLIEQTHELAIVNTEMTKNIHQGTAPPHPPHTTQEE